MLSLRPYEGGPVRKGRRQRSSSDRCAVWAQAEHGQGGEKARSEGAQAEWGEVKLLLRLGGHCRALDFLLRAVGGQ